MHVKPGDAVEAGDVMSEGIPNPAEIVHHKGIGEGRRHFVGAFVDGMRASNMPVYRRNVELIAAGLVNHVQLTDEHGDHSPGDVVRYSDLERTWKPRLGTEAVSPSSAVGKYLERPVLHHSIGTKIRRSMLPELSEFGIDKLHVHRDPPPFEPVFVRGMATLQHHPDWLSRHLGSGIQKGMLEAVHRGGVSDSAGASYVPAVAERTTFGRQGLTRGWEPRDADRDGRIEEGTPRERPKRSLLDGI